MTHLASRVVSVDAADGNLDTTVSWFQRYGVDPEINSSAVALELLVGSMNANDPYLGKTLLGEIRSMLSEEDNANLNNLLSTHGSSILKRIGSE